MLIMSMFLFGCGSSEEETVANNEPVEELVIENQEEETEEVEEQQEKENEQETEVEEQEEETTEEKAEDASLSQADMNELSNEIYVVWDDVLNELWGILKDTQDENTMNDLLKEQREWIDMKEAEAQKAGEEFAGGSMQALVVNQKAAELTKVRVYELADYLGV